MKPVFQTRFGRDGNCWPACIASILDLPLEETDHLACANEDWDERTMKFLKERGLSYIDVRRNPDGSWPITAPPNGMNVILGVTNPRSSLPHCVVAQVEASRDKMGFNIVHDPIGSEAVAYREIDACIFIIKLT